MTYRIEEIEGIGKAFGDRLRAAGVEDTAALPAKSAGPKDRAAPAEATGIPEKLVRQIPAPKAVEGWIAAAKELPRALTH